ncbi:HLA class II histocompatibility antigen, DQ alpha 1 chain-like [Apteryx mantelli]|uniref:HLA class II histocompatibility antigen, DQ alpha 1 chain-like n=1 Tax=Apteryx mantelli TaxID=2696672 RepID=A0ABM4FXS5_9AVES
MTWMKAQRAPSASLLLIENWLEKWLNGKAQRGGPCLPHKRPELQEVPEVTVFSVDPVELGDPNMLICYVDKFWPPMITIKWLKNGQEVVDGVVETIFYLCQDHTFCKFSYLPFIPTWGDYYDCRVEHWGLSKALLKHWEPQVPLPVSESTETLVCALGLAMDIVDIIVGTVLIIKAMKMKSARKVQGPL